MDQAARLLRNEAVQAYYAGLARPEVANTLAGVLDELARHLFEVPEGLRAEVLRAADYLAEKVIADHPDNRAGRRVPTISQHRR